MIAGTVVDCIACGEVNWLPQGWDARSMPCTRCGIRLGRSKATLTSVSHSGSSRFLSASSSLLSLLTVAAIAFFVWFGTQSRDHVAWLVHAYLGINLPRAPIAPSAAPVAARPPEAPLEIADRTIKPGVVRTRRSAGTLGTLRLRGREGVETLVKIFNVNDQQEEALIYLKGNRPIEIKLPAGTYEVRIASGSTWLGLEQRFGASTQYARLSTMLVYQRAGSTVKGLALLDLADPGAVTGGARLTPLNKGQY